MTTLKTHPCIRCGIAIHPRNKCCADCAQTDPLLIKAWRKK